MGNGKKQKQRPLQKQQKPNSEKKLMPQPKTEPLFYPKGKLKGKVAIVTGGDSGIGKAICLLFAKEGADLMISYLTESEDAKATKREVETYGGKCYLIKGNLGKEKNCEKVIQKTLAKYGKIDILINNAGTHWDAKSITDISSAQLLETFHSNFFSMFWLTKFAVPHLRNGSSIINTTSVTAYRGSDHLLDYAATKGAILSFTRSLSANLIDQGIRVNAVAPGPIWTPLIASTFPAKEVAEFGSDTPMERAGEPYEVATCYLFLASEDASYITGQVLHPNGGEIING